ncbi:MAG: hypothetical protein ACTTJ7_08810 [Treponema sp.]
MHKTFFPLKIFVLIVLFCFSCKNQEKKATPVSVHEQGKIQTPIRQQAQTHWYTFILHSDNSLTLQPIDSIDLVPFTNLCPWTEATRVVDFGLMPEYPAFLLNKYGLLPLDTITSRKGFAPQHELLATATAGELYAQEQRYYIRLYKNFQFSQAADKKNECFLLEAAIMPPDIFYKPFAFTRYMQLPPYAQCTALACVKDTWYASFKIDDDDSVSFSHIKCPHFKLLGQAHAQIEQISAGEFRAVYKPASIDELPTMVNTIVKAIDIPETLYIRFSSDERIHSTLFKKSASATHNEKDAALFLEAHAILYTDKHKERYAALLLPNGTLFINSGTTGVQRLRLPSLPDNFLYTYFFIQDDTLIAAWEEKLFYEIGRTGLFIATLQELK